MAGEFLVGAVFELDAAPAISSLEAIGRAFETLGTALNAGVRETTSAVDRMVAQIGRVAEAWRMAAAESGGAGRGGSLGGSGGRGRLTDDERVQREAERQLRDDRLNADAMNRNENQIYARQEAAARRENADINARLRRNQREREGGGTYGPPVDPEEGYAGYDEAGRMNDRYNQGQRMNADAENRSRAQADRARASRNAARWHMSGGIFAGMGPFIAPVAGFEAEKGAMTEDRALTQALVELGLSVSDPGFAAAKERLRGRVSEGTLGTIYSESHGAGVLPGTAGQFAAALPPGERVEKYEEVLPGALKFAEVAEQYHRGSVTESLKAAFAYANMTHPKTAGQFGQSLDTLLAVALSTGNTIASEQNTLKYSIPIGQAAGVPSEKIAAVTGFFEMMGMSGTTAGTGVGQLIMGLTNTGGPLAAQQSAHRTQRAVEHSFEDVLHLKPEALHGVSKSRGNEHVIAMKALGLFDASGHVDKAVAPGGKLNIDEMFTRIEAFLAKTPSIDAMGTLAKAFTVRGSREADLFADPDMAGRMKTYIEGVLHPKSADTLQKELATTPLQQFEQMLANVANIGNTLATATLGPLNVALKTMNDYLIGFNSWLKEHQGVAAAGGWGLLGLAGASALGLAGATGKFLWNNTGAGALWRGGRSLMSRGVSAAEGGASLLGEDLLGSGAAGGWSVAGVSLPLLGGAAMLGAGAMSGKMGAPMVDEFGRVVGNWGGPQANAPRSPAQLSVTVGPITMNGVPDDSSLHGLMAKITSGIHSALSHMTSDPHGIEASPYTQPGWTP